MDHMRMSLKLNVAPTYKGLAMRPSSVTITKHR